MITDLTLHAAHQGGMRVQAGTGGHVVLMDYPLHAGDAGAGMTPLQMLLASLAGCSANSLMVVLKKMNQAVEALEVEAHATRRQEHPTVLTEITLEFIVKGQVATDAVARAIKVSEEQLCPVWTMLKGSTPIRASFHVVENTVSEQSAVVH